MVRTARSCSLTWARGSSRSNPLKAIRLHRLGPFPADVVDEEASGLFLYLNASKESVTADITRPAGRDLVAALAARADILVENFAPGAMARYGLSFETLHSANRRLVVTSLTPFGQYGPYARWKGPEIVRQAVGGWLMQGGLPDREPLMAGANLSLYVSGACCAGATLIAYLHARATGEGQHVDVSAMEALITCSGQEIYKASRGQVTWDSTGSPESSVRNGALPGRMGRHQPAVRSRLGRPLRAFWHDGPARGSPVR